MSIAKNYSNAGEFLKLY